MTEGHGPLLNEKDKLVPWAEFFHQKSEEMFWNSWKAPSLKMLEKPSQNIDRADSFQWEEILVVTVAQL